MKTNALYRGGENLNSGLPYDGDIQAAMRANDRPAIRQIFAARAAAERGEGEHKQTQMASRDEDTSKKGLQCYNIIEGTDVSVESLLDEGQDVIVFETTNEQKSEFPCVNKKDFTDDLLQKALITIVGKPTI